MEETIEIYDQYSDKYEEQFDYDSYYNHLAERDDLNWEDNCDE